MIVGLLNYKDKQCVFKLFEEKFKLEIEVVSGKEDNDIDDFISQFGKNTNYAVDDVSLTGVDFKNEKTIRFNISKLYHTMVHTYTAHLNSYLILDRDETSFNGLQIQGDELNWFHDIKQAYKSVSSTISGEAQVQITNLTETTKTFEFEFEQATVDGNISITRRLNTISTTPIELFSALNFHFLETKELNYIEDLIFLIQRMLKFVTYRENFNINKISLKKKDSENDKYIIIGNLFIYEHRSVEEEKNKNKNRRIIDYPLLEGSFPNLLNKLAKNEIYLKHIPESLRDAGTITSARYIMVTAGFEWQFKSLYKKKSEESEDKYRVQKEDILNFLDEKIKHNTGKNKKFFKSYKKLIERNDSSLSEKIVMALEEFNDVLEVFINNFYNVNGISSEEYTHMKIAGRIQNERNNVAHGNIDKDINYLSGLDFSVLEWLYYSMVLEDIGMSHENIKKSINRLFDRRIAL